MKFTPTPLNGAFVVEVEPKTDFRGSFARLWCEQEFKDKGLNKRLVQISLSRNTQSGTVRGMHFQWLPSQEAKLVRCERGCVYDVVIDLRPDSATFTQHFALELDSEQGNAIYIPPGFAHGYQTLKDNSDLIYMMSDTYQPRLTGGVRYDDPAFAIKWPMAVTSILDRDRDYPDFNRENYTKRYAQVLADSQVILPAGVQAQ